MISKYGGVMFWQEIAHNFHEKVKNDSLLREFFVSRTHGEAAMINFSIFRVGFGENVPFFEEAVEDAHKDRGITKEQYNRFLDLLRELLLEDGVHEDDTILFISRISAYEHIIVQHVYDNL